MFPFCASFGVLFIVVLTSFEAGAKAAVRTYWLRAGAECPNGANYPRSHCQLATKCSTHVEYLEQNLLTPDEIPGCGFLNAGHSYMICCPDTLPEKQPAEQTSTKPTRDSPTGEDQTNEILTEMLPTNNADDDVTQKPINATRLTVNHLASLGYYKPVTLDEIIYRCTAIIVSPTKVLATINCVGSKVFEKPNSVLVGVRDPRINFDPQMEFEIKQPPQIYNDLVLFELHSPIDKDMLSMANVSIATLCNEEDLRGVSTMHAVGFSQYNGRNCDLFVSSQMEKANCSSVLIERQVHGINSPISHLCLQPRRCPISLRNKSCSECLTASTSVLHVKRIGGSFCVAAIATPTSNKCIASEQPVYYTSLVSYDAKKFLDLHDQANME